jgi:hypothetical protein
MDAVGLRREKSDFSYQLLKPRDWPVVMLGNLSGLASGFRAGTR